MRFFEIQRSQPPPPSIRKTALCELPSGKPYPHDCRISRALLEQVESRLHGIGRKLAKAADFAELHRLVEEEIGRIKCIGALTVYEHSSPYLRTFRESTGTRVPVCGHKDRSMSSVEHCVEVEFSGGIRFASHVIRLTFARM